MLDRASGVPTVPAGRASVAHELIASLEFARLLTNPVFTRPSAPRGPRPPVLVIPGFLAPDLAMTTMVSWLRRRGFYACVPRSGLNLRCGERAIEHLESRLEQINAREGRRVVVIGHSRGGQLARVLAARHADLVEAAVTLGTPTPLDLRLTHPIIRVAAGALGLASTFGLRGVLARECFVGRCCAAFRRDLVADIDAVVELTCVVGTRDGLVARHACVDPEADLVVEVPASHLGTVVNAETYRAIDDVLTRAMARYRRRTLRTVRPRRRASGS